MSYISHRLMRMKDRDCRAWGKGRKGRMGKDNKPPKPIFSFSFLNKRSLAEKFMCGSCKIPNSFNCLHAVIHLMLFRPQQGTCLASGMMGKMLIETFFVLFFKNRNENFPHPT